LQTIFGLEFPVFAAAILLADLQIGKADPSINLMRGIVSMVETGVRVELHQKQLQTVLLAS